MLSLLGPKNEARESGAVSAEVLSVPDGARQQFLLSIECPKTQQAIAFLGAEHHDVIRLFPRVEGTGYKRDVQRRFRMVHSLTSRLDHLLYPDERIEFVTTGTLNSVAERFLMGWFSLLLNQTLFVFTNYRVILVHSSQRGEAKTMTWQIPYDQIATYKPGGALSGTVVFELRDGGTYRFSRIPRSDRKALRAYVTAQMERVAAQEFEFPHHAGRDALCPGCSTPTAPGASACTACDETFLNPLHAGLLSAVLPGLGDLYLGHFPMAVVELLTTLVVWGVITSSLLAGGLANAPIAVFVLGVYHGWDALITYHVARKGVLRKSDAWGG